MQTTARTTHNQSHPNIHATNPSPPQLPPVTPMAPCGRISSSSPKYPPNHIIHDSAVHIMHAMAMIGRRGSHDKRRRQFHHHVPLRVTNGSTARRGSSARNSAGQLHFSARWTRCGQGISSAVLSPAGRVESEALPRTPLYFSSPSSVAARMAEGTRTT